VIAFLAAIIAGILPERTWGGLESRLPLRRAACLSGVATLSLGFFLGFDGFLTFIARTADANNAWMLRTLSLETNEAARTAAALVPYQFSALSLFAFLFLTPLGLLCVYLVASGSVRAVSAFVDDPRGDFVLSFVYWAAKATRAKVRQDRARVGRERREGPETPDVLQTGDWAGLTGVDYVVLASRRKPEWTEGAIILTSAEWYRLGAPFDIQTPAGVRTAYPLRKMDTVEVVRRGIRYELPRLARRHRKED
jgi:hypothetical protein